MTDKELVREAEELITSGWPKLINLQATSYHIDLIQRLLEAVKQREWKPIDTMPRDEENSYLVFAKHTTDSGHSIVQVSWFEGQLYADMKEGIIDWEDAIGSATHWQPLPPKPEAGGK